MAKLQMGKRPEDVYQLHFYSFLASMLIFTSDIDFEVCQELAVVGPSQWRLCKTTSANHAFQTLRANTTSLQRSDFSAAR